MQECGQAIEFLKSKPRVSGVLLFPLSSPIREMGGHMRLSGHWMAQLRSCIGPGDELPEEVRPSGCQRTLNMDKFVSKKRNAHAEAEDRSLFPDDTFSSRNQCVMSQGL